MAALGTAGKRHVRLSDVVATKLQLETNDPMQRSGGFDGYGVPRWGKVFFTIYVIF